MAHVEIYTRAFCGFCSRAKALLDQKGVPYDEIDVGFGGEKRREMMDRAPGRNTVPQIFIDNRHIGGCDDMMALERRGELDPLLKA